MSPLVLAHVVTGLLGILAGAVALVGVWVGRRMPAATAVFFVATFAAVATGFVFLPTDGVTSAQLVSFFVTFLLALAAYARFVAGRGDQGAEAGAGGWGQVYALAVVGTLFLNVLITTTQSFLHVPFLNALAPTEQSPVYVVIKGTLLVLFIALAVATAVRVRQA